MEIDTAVQRGLAGNAKSQLLAANMADSRVGDALWLRKEQTLSHHKVIVLYRLHCSDEVVVAINDIHPDPGPCIVPVVHAGPPSLCAGGDQQALCH
jgi:hypothetical protein